jgi:hypothetical protein
MVLEDLCLSMKCSHADSIKVKKIYGLLKTKVFWGVTPCHCNTVLL